METDYQIEALRILRDPRTMYRRWLMRSLSQIGYPLIVQFNWVRMQPANVVQQPFNGYINVAMTQEARRATIDFCNWAYRNWPIPGHFTVRLFPGMTKVTKRSTGEAPHLVLSVRKALETVFPSQSHLEMHEFMNSKIFINHRYSLGTAMNHFHEISDSSGTTYAEFGWRICQTDFDLRICDAQGEPFK